MREIVLDTETTGLDPASGHRVIEIGCVELVHRKRTGQVFHYYLNPERDVPQEAFRIHGISTEFLKDKPLFSSIAEELHAFLAEATLVIHNAQFDLKFLNHEFKVLGLPTLAKSPVIDTLQVARRRFPGSPASLDALCKRFRVDLSKRDKHGALLDAELLTEIYIELTGGAQESLSFAPAAAQAILTENSIATSAAHTGREPILSTVSAEEELAHNEFLRKLPAALFLQDE